MYFLHGQIPWIDALFAFLLILTTLNKEDYYLHFTGENTEAQNN